MDWASPSNWAEKMDVEIVPIPITVDGYRKLDKAKDQRYLHARRSKETRGIDVLAELDKGIDDLENGRITPHEESMNIIRQRYNDYAKNEANIDKAIGYDERYRIIKKYIDEYDYYSLLEHGAPDDEFDSYSRALVDRITAEDSIEIIAESIAAIFDDAFANGANTENYMDLAKKIRMALRNED